jgi:hypothetical protein
MNFLPYSLLISLFLLISPSVDAKEGKSNSGPGISDTTLNTPKDFGIFILLSSGIGSINSTYTTEVVTGGYGGLNNVDDFLGKGYSIPLNAVAGVRINRFRIGLGFSRIAFHVPSLTRTSSSVDSTNASGALVKNQLKSYGINYAFPLFIGYELWHKNHFSLDFSVNYGIFFHDTNAYDGTYAPSATPNTPGYCFSFGFSPAYHAGKFFVLLNPCMGLTHVSYHGSTNEDLTDLYFTLGIGAGYNF